MASLFELFDPKQQPAVPRLEGDAIDVVEARLGDARSEIEASTQTGEILSTAATTHGQRIMETHGQRGRRLMEASQALLEAFRLSQAEGGLAGALMEYQRDAAERAILTADTLRKRGDIFLDHEAANCPPVLIYDYEVIMDGKDLPYPCNYMLLKICRPKASRSTTPAAPMSSSTRVRATAPASAVSRPTVRWASRCAPATRSISWPSARGPNRGSICPMSPAPKRPSCAK